MKRPKVMWTNDEISILATGMPTHELMLMLPGRTKEQIMEKRKKTFGKKWASATYTSQEIDILKEMYAKSIPLPQIMAAMEKASGNRRALGGLHQQILKYRLKRESRKTRLVERYGLDVLKLGDSVDEINARLASEEALRMADLHAKNQAEVKAALEEMMKSLAAGMTREVAFATAMSRGATLQDIGHRVGITRERVRQLVQRLENPDQSVPQLIRKAGRPRANLPVPYVKHDETKGRWDYGLYHPNLDDPRRAYYEKFGSEADYASAADRADQLNRSQE